MIRTLKPGPDTMVAMMPYLHLGLEIVRLGATAHSGGIAIGTIRVEACMALHSAAGLSEIS
ncbi:hypothetical protein WOLCODRAFT_29503 [Wolfiporia cocos MD-104 SS10]|uniref:Uncharacterized protein n=1 Tax=Wolfiporia cocos (strain MD-104) TaxID=742152 RepID=A0A2H3JAR9_WOLCO|nr:hypothetical protein WOLCODRAFT_29503 [Wolfiporia cocos MD-104 SS10]